jgi:hypothetical protein
MLITISGTTPARSRKMNKTLENLGIKFGRQHIASNDNFYRVARPTEEFWDWYKSHKQEMKDAGYSVYKHPEYGFCVYDWTFKDKATEVQKSLYKKEEAEWEAKRIHCAWEQIAAEVEERGAIDEAVAECNTWDDIRAEVERLYDNPDYVMKEDIMLNVPREFYWS